MSKRIPIFITAFFQVFFVAMQPLFIINHRVFPMLVCGFLISLIWTFNVKRVAFGDFIDRFVYASGAMLGTGIGYWVSMLIVDKIIL